ncbi:MAG: hypothetical protein ACFB4I_17510 [Cyanophyceae cyanobacterium]
MALPEGFSEAENLQDVITLVVNKEVRQWFSDVDLNEADPDLGNDRARLRWACTHKEQDTIDMTILRLRLFDTVCGWAQEGLGKYYGMPIYDFDMNFRYKPQISLHFWEDRQDVADGMYPVRSRISFRLMGETSENMTRAEVERLADRIDRSFNVGSGFIWRRGKDMLTYNDRDRGYWMQILCRSQAEGRRVVEQVLDVQQHTPDWSLAAYKENLEPTQAYPTVPPPMRILNETYREPRRRPIADVRFRYALLHLWGKPYPVTLVDNTNQFRDAIAS